MAPLPGGGIMGHHGVDVSPVDEDPVPGAAHIGEGGELPPVGLGQGSLPFQRRWKHPTTAPNLNTRRNLSSTTEDATHMIESLPWYHPRYSFHTSNRGAALFDNPFHEAILFLSGVYGKVQPHSTSHQQIPDSILQKCRFSHNLRYSFCLLLSKKVVCLYRVMPRGGLCKLYP